MVNKSRHIDMAGMTPIVDGIRVNATKPGQLGAEITATEVQYLDGLTIGTVTASKAVVVDANKDIGDFRNLDVTNLDAGLSGTAGSVDVFPTTALKGKVSLIAADSAGDTTTTIVNASQAAARTYTIPDAGASASFVMTEGAQTVNGTKTVPTLVTTNLDAGASGTAGTIDIFPTTALKGKLAVTCADQTGNTTVTLNANAMGQATTVNVPDPGAAASYLAQSTAALTLAEVDVLDGVTAGTVTASKALVVDASKNIATLGTVGSAAHTITSADASALAVGLTGATNPSFVVDSSTALQAAGLKVTGAATGGTVAVAAVDSGAATNLTINAKGTGTIGIGSVSTGAVTITPAVTVTNLDAGASGTAGSIDVFPTTAAKGKIALTAADSAGDTTTTITNASQAGARIYTLPDAGASGKFVLGGGNAAVALTGTGGTSTGTMTTLSAQVTSDAITTAGAATHVATITYTGVAATDLVFITKAGGTNTATENYSYHAVCTANTITVTLSNHTAATALNGNVKFNILVVKT